MRNKSFRLCAPDGAGPATVGQLLREGTGFLSRAGIETARLDAEMLLGTALGRTREGLYLGNEMTPDPSALELYTSLLRRRCQREPVAYITGEREFWSREFHVTAEVLVPRPETEMLVEVTLRLLKGMNRNSRIGVLELGTGSGAIAVSLAKELSDTEVWATDISPGALDVARRNARRHEVEKRVHFLQGDAFSPVRDPRRLFDLIVSNPPYVRRGELQELPADVREWEPRLALDGGIDGLDFYRSITREAPRYLVEGGFLVLEIGADMADEVQRLIAGVSGYGATSVSQDYGGKDRVVVTRRLPCPDRVDREVVRDG